MAFQEIQGEIGGQIVSANISDHDMDILLSNSWILVAPDGESSLGLNSSSGDILLPIFIGQSDALHYLGEILSRRPGFSMHPLTSQTLSDMLEREEMGNICVGVCMARNSNIVCVKDVSHELRKYLQRRQRQV